MWFSKRNSPIDLLQFGLQNLKATQEGKWLGVFLDPKLSFACNFKAEKTVDQLKFFGNSRRGTREAARVRLIKSVLVSLRDTSQYPKDC
jgi:hypothetical protein